MQPEFKFMPMGFPIFAAVALIPLLIGFIWYNPKVFGKAWMNSIGMTEESMRGGNMILIFGLTYVFSFLLAAALNFAAIHQFHLFSLVAPHGKDAPNAADMEWLKNAMDHYSTNYRTYSHGAIHGFIFSFTALLPVIGVNALFERRGFKYIGIHWGFWAVCCIIMGAIICQWAPIR